MYRTYQVPVRFVEAVDKLVLRELNGRDEQRISGTTTSDAIGLIQRLLHQQEPDNFTARQLVASDRDIIQSAIYERTFGSHIQGTLDCPECGDPYDFDFHINDIRNHLLSERRDAEVYFKGGDVCVRVDAEEFKLPNGNDELHVQGMDPEQASQVLMEKSCLDYSPEKEADIEQIFSDIAPIMSLEMESVCPECGSSHTVQFDMQHYLLTRIKQEQQFLQYEIHRIASEYRWHLNEILELPRRLRKQYVAYIENDLERGVL